MVTLHREMKQPKAVRIAPPGTQERESNARKNVLTAEWGEARAQRDVDGLTRAVPRASQVRRAPPSSALTASARAYAAPPARKHERKLTLLAPPRSTLPARPPCHLESSHSARGVIVNRRQSRRAASWCAGARRETHRPHAARTPHPMRTATHSATTRRVKPERHRTLRQRPRGPAPRANAIAPRANAAALRQGAGRAASWPQAAPMSEPPL